jgi:K+-transporting ATPase ATPase B chain
MSDLKSVSSDPERTVSKRVIFDSFLRLNPKRLLGNPVMLVVELCFFLVLGMALYPQAFPTVASRSERGFYSIVALILLMTVWFGTLSDAIAERQARNTANSLRKLEEEVPCKKVITEGWERRVIHISSSQLKTGDVILLEKGDVVPIDSEVLEGIAMVDESLMTGESTPVRKAPSDPLIGGSRVVSDSLVAKVTTNPESSYINQMIRLVESSKRPKTPNEQAITVVLLGLTVIFSIVVASLLGLSVVLGLGVDLSVLLALYVCLLPTTIGALLPAIGLSGMTRLHEKKVIAKSGRAIETAGDTDTILLDKTGTITVGSREAVEFIPLNGYTEKDVGEAAFLASWYDDTPEGRSIIRLASDKGYIPKDLNALALAEVYEFSASTRTSGVKLYVGGSIALSKGTRDIGQRLRFRKKFAESVDQPGYVAHEEEIIKGAPDAVKSRCHELPPEFEGLVESISSAGDTAMAISRDDKLIGLIRLKDVIKPGIKEKIEAVKALGIRPLMITGDQPLTAKSIASEVGIDDFVPQAKPEDKYHIVLKEQAQTRVVAMIGDGTNDAPALAAADVGLAMNSGTQAAKEAANMVDLESNPAKIIDVVMLGKQLLMTRGAVTAFSIANDVAKYFAIVPVMFSTVPQLQALNVLGLGTHTAVISALIFNAIVIPLLIPLAMKGVTFRPSNTMTIFLKNVLIYGLGGVVVPFVGIKLIDILLTAVGLGV